MADRDLLSKLLSPVKCSPRITARLLVVDPAVQWAAVSTCLLLIRVPPQKGVFPLLETSPTCQGYSLASVATPPTILSLLTSPHTHLLTVDPLVVLEVAGDVVVLAVPADVVVVAEVVVPAVPAEVVADEVIVVVEVDEEEGSMVVGSLEM